VVEMPTLDHGNGSAFPGPFSLYTISLKFWAMVVCTRKAKFGQKSIRQEKPGFDHGHSDQESHIWILIIRTLKAKFGPWSFGPEKTGLDYENSVLRVFFQSMRTKDN
jgi:hypothetical protein